jgi:hypothetical protein
VAPRPVGLSPGVAALVGPLALGAVVAILGCGAGARSLCTPGAAGGGEPSRCTAGEQRGAGSTTARSGGLTVRLVVAPTPVRRGSAVRIEVAAQARHAPGALGYLLRYGDGTTSGSHAVPQFCLSGAGKSVGQTWRLGHRYPARGRYVVSVSVYVNCTDDRATAAVPVVVN